MDGEEARSHDDALPGEQPAASRHHPADKQPTTPGQSTAEQPATSRHYPTAEQPTPRQPTRPTRPARRAPATPTFDAFVAAELDGLARYARVLTGDRQQAHDVLTDALVQARLKWKRVGAMEFPTAYVRRMVTTTFLAERRRWSTRNIQPVASPPEIPTKDPTTSVDDRAALHAALAALPRQQRAAVVLRFYLDLPDDDIAHELGCSAGAVRGYVSRGLAALRVDTAELGNPTYPLAGEQS